MANQRKYYACIVISGLLSVITVGNVMASRLVKIATISGRPSFSFDRTKGRQVFIDQIIVFWKKEINQVLPDKPDLVLLPEICDILVNIKPDEWKEYLEVRGTQVMDLFSLIAKTNHCYIAYGTMRIDEDGKFRNSTILLDRVGKLTGIYDKNFPTIGEIGDGIKPGDEVPVFKCDFGRVALAICFDLNFEELLVKYEKAKPDIILFPSNYHGMVV